MKKFSTFILVLIAVLLTLPTIQSCKKGDQDPSFSLISRKTRLCQDWKITSYKKTIQTNDSIIAYTFDGSTFVKITSNDSYQSPGSMRLLFSKTGSYQWDQTTTTDTSSYIYSEKGMWYFSGGGKETGTKTKEVIALQKTDVTESFSAGSVNSTISYFGSGDLETNTYRLRKLSNEEVIIDGKTTTTYFSNNANHLEKITTEIILQPL
jgi:hypothetical protein